MAASMIDLTPSKCRSVNGSVDALTVSLTAALYAKDNCWCLNLACFGANSKQDVSFHQASSVDSSIWQHMLSSTASNKDTAIGLVIDLTREGRCEHK
jgi:hypothetical protein